ncbi:MAG: hypothetical protein QJR09_11890 [Micrococcus sp.]|nr:hypothetical protein [Micrococcus sp.]
MSLFSPALGGLLHRETITVVTVTEGEADPFGEPTTTASEKDHPGYNVQPVGTTESVGDQTVITRRYRVSGPAITGITEATRIRWRGQDYELEGDDQQYVSGALDHMELIITRSTPG